MRSLFAVALVLMSGCNLYFGGGDDDCYYAEFAPSLELRDPETGECQPFGNGGGCGNSCGPCAETTVAQPDWGQCFSRCDAFDEPSCVSASGCRAAYLNDPRNDGGPQFLGCWEVAPSGPIQGGHCTNLDAQACSRHDDCGAIYTGTLGPNDGLQGDAKFTRCIAEKPVALCQNDESCAADERCTASEECLPPPGCDSPNGGCPAVCYGRCVPLEPGCANVDCDAGTHCQKTCTGDPTTGTTDPAGCSVSCVPDIACSTLATELACTARMDCYPVYEGEDCTCDPSGCVCNVLIYDRCQAWNTPPPQP